MLQGQQRTLPHWIDDIHAQQTISMGFSKYRRSHTIIFFIILMNEKGVSISVYLENKTTIIRLSPCVHITFWAVTFRFLWMLTSYVTGGCCHISVVSGCYGSPLKTKSVRKDGSKCRKIDLVLFSGALLVSCSSGGFGGVFPYARGLSLTLWSSHWPALFTFTNHHSQTSVIDIHIEFASAWLDMHGLIHCIISKVNHLIKILKYNEPHFHDDCIDMIAVHAEIVRRMDLLLVL